MLKEFKEFISRGNVMDLAVAVIIGAAFGAIVTSLVADIITPLILKPAMEKFEVEELEKLVWNGAKVGKFLAAVINFLVVAFSIFIIVKAMNKAQNLRKKKEQVVSETPSEPAPTKEETLLTEIRDLLKNK